MRKMNGIVLKGLVPQLRTDIPVPEPQAGEVLVRITHATVNGHEIELAASSVMRLLGKLMGARGEVQTGLEFTGTVQTSSSRFKKGDEVLGYVDMTKGWKPHADYVAIPEDFLALRPEGLSAIDAAAIPMSAQTALVALRDMANVQPGDRVLVVGASGGVGLMAVQIGRLLGGQVTAVANPKHHQLLLNLGAEETVNSGDQGLASLTGGYVLILDMTTMLRFKQVRHLLAERGVFLPANPLNSLWDIMFKKQVQYLWVDKGDHNKLAELTQWALSGDLKSVIDGVYPVERLGDAFARALERGKAGRVVLELGASG